MAALGTAISNYLLKLLPGETAKIFAVTVAGDTIREATETFVVLVEGALPPTLSFANRGAGFIVNGDEAPRMAINDVATNEGDGVVDSTIRWLRFTIDLNKPLPSGVNACVTATVGGTATPGVNDVFPAWAASGSLLCFIAGERRKTL